MSGRGRLRATLTTSWLAGAWLAVTAGCSYPSAQQPEPGTCAPLTVVSSTPLDGASGLPTDGSIRLDMSDFPDPDSVRLDTVLLSSGI